MIWRRMSMMVMALIAIAALSGCENDATQLGTNLQGRLELSILKESAKLRLPAPGQSQGEPTTLTFTVLNDDGTPRRNQRVYWEFEGGVVSVSPNYPNTEVIPVVDVPTKVGYIWVEGRTDDFGRHAVQLAAGSTTVVGKIEFRASIEEFDETEAGSDTFLTKRIIQDSVEVVEDFRPCSRIELASLADDEILRNNSTTLSVICRDDLGQTVDDGTQLQFEIISPTTTDATLSKGGIAETELGKATITFQAGQELGNHSILVSSVDDPSVFYPNPDLGDAGLSINVIPPEAGSIECVGANPSIINIRGSGLSEVSTVVFEVRNRDNTLASGNLVTFDLIGPGGGESLENVEDEVVNGQAEAQVSSGSASGPVTIVARINQGSDNEIVTQCSVLNIAGGNPAQLNMHMAMQETNIEGLICTNRETEVRIDVADRYGNFVPLGNSSRQITVFSEAGAVRGAVPAGDKGRASATHSTQAPYPTDLMPQFSGLDEPFLDVNGNGIRDAGEPFEDVNLSGAWESNYCVGEWGDFCQEIQTPNPPAASEVPGPPADYNSYVLPNLYRNPADGIVNIIGIVGGEESFVDKNSNGIYDQGVDSVYDLGEPWVDANGNGMYDGIQFDFRRGFCVDPLGQQTDCSAPYTEPFYDLSNNGVYDAGVDPFKDLNNDGIRTVEEVYVDNDRLETGHDGVYDGPNREFDRNTLIFPLEPGFGTTSIPGVSLIWSGYPVNRRMQHRETYCIIDGQLVPGPGGSNPNDCFNSELNVQETLAVWDDGFYQIEMGQTKQFRMFVADRNGNPIISSALSIDYEGDGEARGIQGDVIGDGSRFVYFLITASEFSCDKTKSWVGSFISAEVEYDPDCDDTSLISFGKGGLEGGLFDRSVLDDPSICPENAPADGGDGGDGGGGTPAP